MLKTLCIASLLVASSGFAAAQMPVPAPKNPTLAVDKQEISADKSDHRQRKSMVKADKANLRAAKASHDPSAEAAAKARLMQDKSAARAKRAELKGDQALRNQDKAMAPR